MTIDDGDDAKSALDRITIPREVLDRIAPTALPRSSIIVSDEPLSTETNYRTEFVAVLSNHPQGGFITRRRSDDVLMGGRHLLGQRSVLFFPRHGPARRQQASARRPIRPSDAATVLAMVRRGCLAYTLPPTRIRASTWQVELSPSPFRLRTLCFGATSSATSDKVGRPSRASLNRFSAVPSRS